jgi:hypothetical protein
MKPTIAITHLSCDDSQTLMGKAKRFLLLFDKIGFVDTNQMSFPFDEIQWNWLLENELIYPFRMDDSLIDKAMNSSFNNDKSHLVYRVTDSLLEWMKSTGTRGLYDPETRKKLAEYLDANARLLAIYFEKVVGDKFLPVVHSSDPTSISQLGRKTNVMNVVLNSFPIPADSTPWEDLLEFKSNDEARRTILALRKWIRDTAKSDLDQLEIAEELEFLIHQYRTHLKIHKIKAKTGILETIVTTTADLIEDFAKFRFGKLAGKFFSIKHKRINLLEAELKAPGNEIAYLSRAMDRFE